MVFGIGAGHTQRAIRRAHDRAVVEAITYVECEAAAVRRGAGGAVVTPAEGLVAAAFRHRTSRAGDPQLHTHVVVANLGLGPDGRWSALDGRRLYAHARTASFIYQAVLRSELSRELGVEWMPVRQGIAELVGVPKTVIKAFSRRRAEIEAALSARGVSSARAAEAAALATRRPKDREQVVEALVEEWRDRAAALDFGTEKVLRLAGRPRAQEMAEKRVFARLAGPMGLTRRSSTFTRRDALQALCELVPQDQSVDLTKLESAADRFLGSREVVPLAGDASGGAGEVFLRRDGRVVPLERAELTYSTVELLAVEQRLVEQAVAGRGSAGCAVSTQAVAGAVAARPTLSEEQQQMIERLCLDGDRVGVVVGRAGTGKTFALGVAREAWQERGHPVLGVAVAKRAAAELTSGAGIASTSVAALLGELRRYDRPLRERCVLVVDEAGMVPTRQLATLLEQVERVDGKLVLVGDHRQLPAIEAGGAFRGLVQRGLATELQENRRQVERWERGALELVRAGHAESALSLYQAQGRLHVGATDDDTREQIVRAWRDAGDPDEAVMIARRREDVAELNARARQHLRAAGTLGDVELAAPGGAFAIGDRVVVKLNDFRLAVHNGDRGRVVAVDPRGLRIELRGRTVRLDAHSLTGRTAQGDPTLVHGYAITGHVAQGLTVDRAFVLADDGMNREWAYTAMSRARLSNHLYVASDPGGAREEFAPGESPRDPLERLTAALVRSDEPRLAIDQHPQAAESRHAALRFVDQDELERRAAASWDRIAERRAQRDRGRGLER